MSYSELDTNITLYTTNYLQVDFLLRIPDKPAKTEKSSNYHFTVAPSHLSHSSRQLTKCSQLGARLRSRLCSTGLSLVFIAYQMSNLHMEFTNNIHTVLHNSAGTCFSLKHVLHPSKSLTSKPKVPIVFNSFLLWNWK
jgi:hypothetical protein